MELKETDSAMIGEAGRYYDIDHLMLRKSYFANEEFEPCQEVKNCSKENDLVERYAYRCREGTCHR